MKLVKKHKGFCVTIAIVEIYANQQVPVLHLQYSALINQLNDQM